MMSKTTNPTKYLFFFYYNIKINSVKENHKIYIAMYFYLGLHHLNIEVNVQGYLGILVFETHGNYTQMSYLSKLFYIFISCELLI